MQLAQTPGYLPGFRDTLSLRELGGLQASDGRHVRHGLLYRGSTLIDLTPTEQDLVDGMDLSFILDLRAARETEGRPDYVPAQTEYLRIAGMYDQDGFEVDFSPASIARLMVQLPKEDKGAFMTGLYASMAQGNRAVRELVRRFAHHQAPLYFHCNAGKDRTGVCAAVLLMLLGVPDDTIIWEFLLTNEYRAEIINNPPAELPDRFPDSSAWAQANGVQERNLRAFLAAVDEGHASREDYFMEEFALDGRALTELRDFYLE